MTYQSTVLADSPSLYYEAQETSGTTATDSSGNGNTGTYVGGITLGQAGGPPDSKSVLLDGSTGWIETSKSYSSAPGVYSIEMWFKTTTTSGGWFATFDNTQSSGSSSDDRNLYMDNSGLLHAWVWTGAQSGASTTTAYNDGNWHHVVVTCTGTGGTLTIYVDGTSVASGSMGTMNTSYSGYWRFGDQPSDTWSPQPTSRFINAYISDIAVWETTALTATQVQNHYNAASGSSPSPITATVSLTGQGSLAATANIINPSPVTASATLTGQGSLSATANVSGTTITASANLRGQGSLSATGTVSTNTVTASASLTGQGSLSATSQLVIIANASLIGQGTLSATVKQAVIVQSITIDGVIAPYTTLQGTLNRSATLQGVSPPTTTLQGTKVSTITLGGEI